MRIAHTVIVALLLLVPREQQQKPPPTVILTANWAVRFSLQSKEDTPIIHLSMLVRATSEGDATMKAFREIQSHLSVISADKLTFYDAQEKR